MVNVFEYERMGIPFNNADSKEAVDGGDYEVERLRKKLQSSNKSPDADLNKGEIYCHECSKAGGAHCPIYHAPPACSGRSA